MTLNHSGVMEIILTFPNYYLMNEYKCPVPKEQQPSNEFIELSKSNIFSWPKTKKSLILVLIKFWLGAFILSLGGILSIVDKKLRIGIASRKEHLI